MGFEKLCYGKEVVKRLLPGQKSIRMSTSPAVSAELRTTDPNTPLWKRPARLAELVCPDTIIGLHRRVPRLRLRYAPVSIQIRPKTQKGGSRRCRLPPFLSGWADWCAKRPARETRVVHRRWTEIGLGGFEPPTPCPPDKYAKPLRYSPLFCGETLSQGGHGVNLSRDHRVR